MAYETQNMLFDWVREADYSLLSAINFPASDAYSYFWVTYTDKFTWMPMAIVAVWCLLRHNSWRGALLMVLSVAMLFLLSDFVIASTLKPWIARLRPSHDPAIMDMLTYVNGYRGGNYGFPSNHASNGFAVAMFLALLYRKPCITACTVLWACGSCYSRMFLGVHFPTDILVGALLGCLIAVIVYRIYNYMYARMAVSHPMPSPRELYASEPWPVIVTFFLTVVFLLIATLLV